MGAIDVWSQIISERMIAQPWMQSLLRWTKQEGRAAPSVEETIAAMDAADIDIALLSAWHGPQGRLMSNREVYEQISKAPKRFRGLATVDLTSPMDSVRELRDYVDGKKFVGVRVVPWLWNLPPDNRLYYPIYAACVDLGVPFCTQVGHTGPLLPSEPGRPIPYLEQVLLDFPELKVVGGHVGFPWINELISLTVKFPNFYLDTSAYAVHRLPPDFVHFMKGLGSSRVMFGTNWPMISPGDCLKGLASLNLSDVQREAYLSGNARRVFGL